MHEGAQWLKNNEPPARKYGNQRQALLKRSVHIERLQD